MSEKTSKEEDEDQWISGEELRTEGSSDEDASEPRAARKKQKTNVLLKRLLVSSLAFPPSHERLPSIEKTNKVARPPELDEDFQDESLAFENDATPALLGCRRKSRVKFNVGDSPESKPARLQESLRKSLELDLPKTHRYEKGETKTTNHLILEMNEFYFEMVDQLKFLRDDLHKHQDDAEDKKEDLNTSDPRLLSILAEIEKDEADYQRNVQLLAAEKQERKNILEEICAPGDHRTRAEPEPNVPNMAEHPTPEKREETKVKGEKDFVAKNKELAKEYGAMSARFCLTDEEKIKLESILSDVDNPEENVDGYCEAEREGGFKLDSDEEKILEELECKLKNLSEFVSTGRESDDLMTAENQGRHWKLDLMQARLKSIDKDLCFIRDEKGKENTDLKSDSDEFRDDHEAEYKKCRSDLGTNFYDGEEGEESEGEEDYEKCLSQINLKIAGARKEFDVDRRGNLTAKTDDCNL